MKKKRVLVIDDEEQLCFEVAFALEMKGYEVATAKDGESALRTIFDYRSTGRNFNIIVSDIFMPGISGEEFIGMLMQFNHNIPILIMSGYGNKDLIINLLRLGCRYFIDKPFTPAVLLNTIEKIIKEAAQEERRVKHQKSLQEFVKKTENMIHDMRNVMQAALGHATSAVKDMEKGHPARRKIESASNSIHLAADICGKIMSKKHIAHQSHICLTDLRLIVEQTAAILQVISPLEVSIRSETPSRPVWVRAHADSLKQALLNLGLNGLDALRGKGELSFSLSIGHSAPNMQNQGEGWASIVVKDTGTGIEFHDLPNIFTRGFTTKKSGGGRGLSIVNDSIEEHGGKITVTSEVGNGTTFIISLPCAQKSSCAHSPLEQNINPDINSIKQICLKNQ